MPSRTIRLEYLTRVEGEGAVRLQVRDGQVHRAQLRIFEPPRFFEALLRGRDYTEAPDITARICGICPVAYQMSACAAIEAACGVTVDGPLADLRRLLYCGEWIESHALHVHLLHAPDFLGYDSAIAMAADHRDEVQRGLDLKKAGNDLLELIGGRAIHPINVRVGGFYRAPTRAELEPLLPDLRWGRDAAAEALRLADRALASAGGGSIVWLTDGVAPEQAGALAQWRQGSRTEVRVWPMATGGEPPAPREAALKQRVLLSEDHEVNQ